LWDPVFFITTTPVNTSSGSALLFGSNSSAVLEEYLEDGSGPWGAAGGHFSFEKIPARLRTNFTNQTEHTLSWFPSDWPEVEYGVAPSPGENGETLGAFGATIVAPSSRGSVSIISSSMADQPLIDLNRLSSPADLEILVAAFKRQREFWNTPAAQAIKTGPETSPGEAIQTDAQIADFIKGNLFGIYHASSTCSMGRKNDTKAVVDHKARVYGVEGLRVVDNSVTPFAVPGHPQATVYMLAEKIADAILRDLRE
jgi:choline dehydrogenase